MNAGMIGTGVTIGAGAVGWTAAAIPVLQVLSLAVSFLVGIVTFVWWAIKLYDRLKNGK
jgi:hypothetical protein